MAANRVMGEARGLSRARVSVSRVSSMSSVWSHTHQVESPKKSLYSKIVDWKVLNEFTKYFLSRKTWSRYKWAVKVDMVLCLTLSKWEGAGDGDYAWMQFSVTRWRACSLVQVRNHSNMEIPTCNWWIWHSVREGIPMSYLTTSWLTGSGDWSSVIVIGNPFSKSVYHFQSTYTLEWVWNGPWI